MEAAAWSGLRPALRLRSVTSMETGIERMVVAQNGRATVVALGRRGLVRLERGPLRRLTTLAAVQRFRNGFKPPVRPDAVVHWLGVLEAAGVRCWLAGGWGVDALVGRQTRVHRDLDLVLDRAHTETALRVLHA